MSQYPKLLARVLVLLVGLFMAFLVTLQPLFNSAVSKNERITELTSGAGIGFIIIALPYVVFWAITRRFISQRRFYLGGIILVALGAIGVMFLLSVSKDPTSAQAGIAYIYVLLTQASVLIFLLRRAE